MNKAAVNTILFIFLSLHLTACATTKWKDQWKDKSFSTTAEDIFVVAVVPNSGPRAIIENELVRQLKERGIKAIGSNEVIQEDTKLTKSSVLPVAKARGADTILVVKFIKRETSDSYAPARDSGVPVTFDANIDSLFQFPETKPDDLPYDFFLATMQLTLYEVKNEKKIWSAISETKYQGGGLNQIKPYTYAVLQKLIEEKLIR